MVRYATLVIALAIGIAACATGGSSSETPVTITDVKQLAGHWTGWVFYPQVRGSTVTTIRPDGTFTASSNYAGTSDVYGTLTVSDGKARYQITERQQAGVFRTPSGTVQLFENGGKRVLHGQSDDGLVKFDASLVQ